MGGWEGRAMKKTWRANELARTAAAAAAGMASTAQARVGGFRAPLQAQSRGARFEQLCRLAPRL